VGGNGGGGGLCGEECGASDFLFGEEDNSEHTLTPASHSITPHTGKGASRSPMTSTNGHGEKVLERRRFEKKGRRENAVQYKTEKRGVFQGRGTLTEGGTRERKLKRIPRRWGLNQQDVGWRDPS